MRVQQGCGAGTRVCRVETSDLRIRTGHLDARLTPNRTACPCPDRPIRNRPQVANLPYILAFALVVSAQAPQPLTQQQAQQLMARSIELMEAGGVALPEL